MHLYFILNKCMVLFAWRFPHSSVRDNDGFTRQCCRNIRTAGSFANLTAVEIHNIYKSAALAGPC